MLLDALGTMLLGNMLTGEEINIAGYGNKGDEMIRAGYESERSLIKSFDQKLMINADVNTKNSLTKVDVIMDLFGIIVYGNVNVTNHVKLENV